VIASLEPLSAAIAAFADKTRYGRAGLHDLSTPEDSMDDKHLKQIADQLDEAAAALIAAAGTFRSAAGGGKGSGGDGKAGGKPAKPAAKPGKGKNKEADEEVTEDTLRDRLKELASTKGKDVMAEALAHVDCERLPDVDEDDYEKLNDKITELLEAEGDDKAGDDAPDFKALTKRFKKLDAKAQKAVLKACGVKAFDDIDEDDDDEVKELAEAIDDAE
jgi:hypothetical protein